MTFPALDRLLHHLQDTILGSHRPARLLLTALLARGHTLVTGPPGIGKTSLAQALATALGGTFRRIQFTPDLLPSDILGYNLYRQGREEFEFIRGPVFAHCLLADEINRASPRTQSALLEAMNEGQVTIDGTTRSLPQPFTVVATQNDRSATGTFPLPEPQLDRFLLSIPMELPSEEVQLTILAAHSAERPTPSAEIISLSDLTALQQRTAFLPVAPAVQRYLLDLCQSVRSGLGQEDLISTRALLALQQAARGAAVLEGLDHVHPDHIQLVFPHVLAHRFTDGEHGDISRLLTSAIEETPLP